jgi:hypothetical protein
MSNVLYMLKTVSISVFKNSKRERGGKGAWGEFRRTRANTERGQPPLFSGGWHTLGIFDKVGSSGIIKTLQ